MNPQFEYSYLELPPILYSKVKPEPISSPTLILFNKSLARKMGWEVSNPQDYTLLLSGQDPEVARHCFAQAYAGHQFGHFTVLGDGRACMLGEVVDPNGNRLDIQLKGSGKTPYSRSGDGKATLKAMLREYLMSETLFYLGIPTSRSLSVVVTGEVVQREKLHHGAILARVMKSHIRIGTFEFARFLGSDPQNLQILLDYTLKRLYPELLPSSEPALDLLKKMAEMLSHRVVDWMRVGFIHGVLNTDNIALSSETFDYGPCAFMNTYDPKTVFSSIDSRGRYAFAKQPEIMHWNLAQLANALLPLIDPNADSAVEKAQDVLNSFNSLYTTQWYAMMMNKVGIKPGNNPKAYKLIDDLLQLMHQHNMDYTLTFASFRNDVEPDMEFLNPEPLKVWNVNCNALLDQMGETPEEQQKRIRVSNPLLIARNVHVEKALDEASEGDFKRFNALLNALSNPYEFSPNTRDFMYFNPAYDRQYQTFCGT